MRLGARGTTGQPDKRKHIKHTPILWVVLLYLVVYAIFSLHSLNQYPFVHSDESWLAGLSRDMMVNRDFSVTESVFDAKPRVSHAIRLLFHALQMGFISVFGYHIGSVRLLSLVAGLFCLFLLFLIGKKMGGSLFGATLMIMVSMNIQFIYSSHFARQEIIICALLLCCIRILLECGGRPSAGRATVLAAITGLGVGIHPNSFLCGTVCVCVMGVQLAAAKLNGQREDAKTAVKGLSVYTVAAVLAASVFLVLSFFFSPSFLSDYVRQGRQEFQLNSSPAGRISEFFDFLLSIFRQESGTYEIPYLKPELIILPLAVLVFAAGYFLLRREKGEEERAWCQNGRVLAASLLGLTAGTVIIGRYNQTTILFFLVLGFVIAGESLLLFGRRPGAAVMAVTAVILAYGSFGEMNAKGTYGEDGYDAYLNRIAQLTPPNARTIGNLNLEFYFDYDMLRDYRNLPYLESGEAIGAYIEEHEIEYIILTGELDYIYSHRPYYNVIYGNAWFIEELKEYAKAHGELVGSFEDVWYGIRVMPIRGNQNYGTVTVYRLPGNSA